MAKFSQDTIQEVMESNDIVDVVSNYVNLKRSGREYRGLCPFHSEKTPSFYVDEDKQVYYCFGCQSGGNVISFIMNIENLSFADAVKFLADRAGITIEEEQKEDPKAVLYRINREAARFYYENLKSRQGAIAYNYLKSRGIKESTIVRFGLGYSQNAWDSLFKYLKAKGYSEEDMVRAGLVIRGKGGTSYFDRYRNRVMFPIIDGRNNVVGFGARSIDGSAPKYLNSPDTEVFNKSSVLYALNIAKRSRSDHFIVVEGYMDAISLHQAGIDYAVASLGTALTQSHVELIKRYKNSVIVAYDADAAGEMATVRGLYLLEKSHLDIRVLEIPEGKDPDEFVRAAGIEAFKKAEDAAVPFIQYRLKMAQKGLKLDNPEEKAVFVQRAADVLADVEDEVKLDAYAKYVAELTGIEENIIKSHILSKVKSKYQQNKNIKYINGNYRHNIDYEKDNAKAIVPLVDKVEETVLSILLNRDDLREKYIGVIEKDLLKHPLSQKVWDHLKAKTLQNENFDIVKMMEILNKDDEIKEVSRIASLRLPERPEDALMEGIYLLKREKLKRLISELTVNINQSKDINIIKKLQQEVMEIKRELCDLDLKKLERRGYNG
ncbi:DNA primase [Caldanaerobius polysaccharolyticus]|uniref:DNA primase n=1 Tax=Caldanaerobius polysaccharolyticus TaxID=44256 RepID=UPI0005563946|nr:DNA primase [Caldanaerobius polysaccharolyticus]